MSMQKFKFIIKESNINFHNWYTTGEGFSHPILKKYAGSLIGSWIMKIENDSGSWGPAMAEWETAGGHLHERLTRGKFPLDQYYKEHKAVGEKIFKLCNEILSQGIEKAGTKKLENWLKKMWDLYYLLNGIGFVAVVSDFEHNLLTSSLTEILSKKEKTGGIQNSLSLLASPNEETLYWQEQLELLQICLRYGSLNALISNKEFRRHQQKYFWLNYGYQGPVWTEQDFVDRARNFLKDKNIERLYREHKENFKILKKQQKEIIARLRLNKQEQFLFEVARTFTYLKGFRIEVRHRYSFVIDSIFTELGRRLYLPLSFFRYALKHEILAAVHKKNINTGEIVARKQLMLMVYKNHRGVMTPKNRIAKKLAELLEKEKIAKRDSVKGQSAYTGIARGKIRIVESVNDLNKVNHGDILVAHGTNPDFLPAMYRASAFVTDQGGITSHAAIVAREMKKPCIIGTKIATKIFNDGDLVEVNADNGIIRKL